MSKILALTWNRRKGRGIVYVVTRFMHKIYALRCHNIVHSGNLVFMLIIVEISKSNSSQLYGV
jgi:hypothetical protein